MILEITAGAVIIIAAQIFRNTAYGRDKIQDAIRKEEYDRFNRMLQDPELVKPVPLNLDFLKHITRDFSESEENVLGRGGFGVLYKGVLQNGKAIVVKRLKILETNLDDEQYQKELKMYSRLVHKNIVQLKGFCAHLQLVSRRERLLCFEYVSNKSLRKHISDASCGLEWCKRFDIIKGICSGLHYLHKERQSAHTGLIPENILLGDNMVPKIVNFGTSRLFHKNQSQFTTDNCVSWPRGYMPPEYVNEGMITVKVDIFSFGVIIMELLTGSKSDYPQSTENFQQFTDDVVGNWRIRLPNAGSTRQVRTCILVALSCVDANRDRRPTAGDIIQKLKEVQVVTQEDIVEEAIREREYYIFNRMLEDPERCMAVSLTLDFLKDITCDFSEKNVLGSGRFGVVYKGVIQNGKAIAVKKLEILETNLGAEQYQKELGNLSGLENKNVVQFLGYCADLTQISWPLSESEGWVQWVPADVRERVICFEYVSNKTLREHISDTSCGLEWLERFEIIRGICSGSDYLHMKCQIAHMNLKPENILLDDNMAPKIADFGTSRLFCENESWIITKKCVGTRGYIAPEYFNQGMISLKADIFSLGVIILELLTGSNHDYPKSGDFFQQFTDDVVEKWRNRLPNAGCSRQVRTCISVALNCVDGNPDRRPTAEDIIKELNEAQDPSRSWSWVKKAIGVIWAVVVMLLKLSSLWPLVVSVVEVVSVAETLKGGAAQFVEFLKSLFPARDPNQDEEE